MYTLSGNKLFKDGFGAYIHTYKEPGPRTRTHAHDFIEIAYVTKGSATHHVGKNKYEILAGDIFVINSYQPHHYTKTHSLKICYLIVAPQMLKEHMPRLKDIPGFYEFFYVEPIFREETNFSQHLHLERNTAIEIENILEKMETELETRTHGYKTMVESLLIEFFVTVSRLCYGFYQKNINTEEIDSKKKAVDEVLDFIEQHYEKDIKLSDLARCGCLQSQYLCRVFRKMTGMTMFQYLTHMRINKASEILTHTKNSITEICFEVGFHDLSYFIRTFRKSRGMTPSDFRKKSI